MIYIKELQIKLPKWKWWQIVIGVTVFLLANKLPNVQALETLKEFIELLKMWF